MGEKTANSMSAKRQKRLWRWFMGKHKDIQGIGIEFGDWKLVPLDSENWELCHRHVTADTLSARKAGTVGKVKWQRLGKYYQHNTIGGAFTYAADFELKQGCEAEAVGLRDAAERWEATLREFRRCVSAISEVGR